jgi:hypothetical protein
MFVMGAIETQAPDKGKDSPLPFASYPLWLLVDFALVVV